MEFERFKKRIWLASPTIHGEERDFVKEAFESNWVSTVGANINELEKGIQDYIGCRAAVALSAGTAAIHLAVKLAGVRQKDVVFCSDMTFVATVNPVLYEKGIPIFIDSERDTWNMDPKVLERAFSIYDGTTHSDGIYYPKPKAVIVANLYGTPAKLDQIQKLCQKYGAVMIEDAAESLGAVYQGKQTGSFGTYNAISFNGNKIITTSGGGMLLTDDDEAAQKVRFWSTQAREDFPWYEHKELGYNYRMSNILAGIGRGQLLHLEEHIEKKKAIYMRYKNGFCGLPVTMNPYLEEMMEPNFWLSCLLIDEEAMNDRICPDKIRERLAQYNVEVRPIWNPMHRMPLYKKCDYISIKDDVNVGEDVFRRGLCLPSDIKMTEEEQDVVIAMIRSCFDEGF
ncbi:MAG: aminotransferase class I/II-fold pyridoxal phosphate-dependent enzyme [Roseburia sp.]|nr:aminotransferase class I/II-fold pyridoxal phosphate-dependent enzyme [Roseburia sp.]MCM1277880.1 aminotransferase class I/II-fold pyridoxal phosphate-dependent enzyme [Robinsoniella sp.]